MLTGVEVRVEIVTAEAMEIIVDVFKIEPADDSEVTVNFKHGCYTDS